MRVYMGSVPIPCPQPPCDEVPVFDLKASPPAPAPMLQVYPNPASGFLFVESLSSPQGGEVKLLNWQGQVVAHQSLDEAGRVRLPLADLPMGLYLVRLRRPDGTKTLSQKVQIN